MNWRGIWKICKQDKSRTMLVLLAATLPFDHTPSVQVYGLSVRASAVIGGLIVLVAARRLLRQRRMPQLPWQWWAALVWLVWVCAGLVWVHDVHAAVKVVVPLATLALIGLSSVIIWRESYFKPVINGILAGALASTAFGFYQFIGNRAGLPNNLTAIREEYSWQRFGFPRMQSTMLEPLYFSAYLLLPIGLLSILVLTTKEYRRWYWYLALGALLLADFLTLSRGGLAALVVLYIALFAQYWNPGFISRYKRKLVIGLVCLVVVFVATLGLISAVSRQGQDSDLTYNKKGSGTFISQLTNFHIRPTKRDTKLNDSIAQRDTARRQAFDIIGHDKRVLLAGVGPGQYSNYEQSHHINGYTAPNNIILEQLVQSGLIGLGLLLIWGTGIVWALLRLNWHQRGNLSERTMLAKLSAAYLVALFLQAQTFTGLALTHLWFVVGLALFLVQSTKLSKHKHHAKVHSKKT